MIRSRLIYNYNCACEFYRTEKSRKRMSAFIFESISTLGRRVLYYFIWFYAILYDFIRFFTIECDRGECECDFMRILYDFDSGSEICETV